MKYIIFTICFLLVCSVPEKSVASLRSGLVGVLVGRGVDVEEYGDGLRAQVVLRETALWNRSLWLNVGEGANRTLSRVVVAKDSPVVIDDQVVGVVEEVKERRCRIRLLTDRMLTVAVRAVRGGEQDRILATRLKETVACLGDRPELYGSKELASALGSFIGRLNGGVATQYLAKGEIHGGGPPMWRKGGHHLVGMGFNYDFPDEMGGARDLRSGTKSGMGESDALLKTGDLLVTTGMDGVFPEGLIAGRVTDILPLQEGECSYRICAEPLISIENLKEAIVLPPR